MVKRLIVNSDDYGRTPEISRGIREAHLQGVVTSTTCMMNIPTTVDDIALGLKETPELGMGVHLVMTMGRPLAPRDAVPSIVDTNGNFFKYDPFIKNLPTLNIDEVKVEWRLQIERFIQTKRRKPTHLDSHHHSSYFTADLFRAMLELAKEFACPIRWNTSAELPDTKTQAAKLMTKYSVRHPDYFIDKFYDDGATQDTLLGIIDDLQDGTSELMCHPGYVDDAFAKESIYNFQRQRELKILTDPSVKQAVESHRIDLITFADL